MNAFDKVIGYKAIKRELLQLCDMLRNREIYEEMGARLPHGLLLYGDPGLGKTLLARCFVEESGLHTHHGTPRQERRRLYRWNYTGLCQRKDKSAVHCPFGRHGPNLPTRIIPTAMRRNMPLCKRGSTM